MPVDPGRVRPRLRTLRRALVWSVLIVAAIVWRPDRALRTATGMAAHDLCSETFVAGIDPAKTWDASIVPRPGVDWLAWGLRHRVDRAHREAAASFLGLVPSRAVFRPHRGCVLVHGDERIDDLPAPPASDAVAAGAIAMPPGLAPAPTPALAAALDAAFAETAAPPHRGTRAVVILHDGRLVAERYAPGEGLDTPMLGFSMTKSVTNALVGVLVRQGRLDVEAPAPIAAWRRPGDPRAAITLERLMRMDSGLALDETGSGFDPSNQMFYDEPDMAAYAASARAIAPPGTRWAYSSASTHLVARIVRDTVGGDGAAVQAFAARELFAPLGMRRVTFEMDATGTPIGAHYLYASARDWARLGQLYLDDGVVGGRRLLPAGWARWSSEPTLGTAYGAGWWTNRGDDEAAVHRRAVGIPADAFFAMGNLGQRIAVVPSEHLVVVRMARAHLRFGDAAGFERLVVDTIRALHPRR
jgi:hypothetical protein